MPQHPDHHGRCLPWKTSPKVRDPSSRSEDFRKPVIKVSKPVKARRLPSAVPIPALSPRTWNSHDKGDPDGGALVDATRAPAADRVECERAERGSVLRFEVMRSAPPVGGADAGTRWTGHVTLSFATCRSTARWRVSSHHHSSVTRARLCPFPAPLCVLLHARSAPSACTFRSCVRCPDTRLSTLQQIPCTLTHPHLPVNLTTHTSVE